MEGHLIIIGSGFAGGGDDLRERLERAVQDEFERFRAEPKRETRMRVELTCSEGFYPVLKENVLESGGEIVSAVVEDAPGYSERAETPHDNGGIFAAERAEHRSEFDQPGISGETVWKFPLPRDNGMFEMELPYGAEILDVQLQFGTPHLWALVNPENHGGTETRRFSFLGTGRPLPVSDEEGIDYVGTVQMDGGHIVRHLFEVKPD